MGLLTGVVVRLLSGDPMLGLAPVIHFPGCTMEEGVYVQYAPLRVISMLSSFAAILLFSHVASLLFHKGLLPQSWDVFQVTRHSESLTTAARSATSHGKPITERPLQEGGASQSMISTDC